MAITQTAPGGTHETQTSYAKEIVAIARLDKGIYADFSEDGVKNDATGLVKVPTRNGEVKVSKYDIKNGVELTQSATEYVDIPMNNHYAVNEQIDGYEAAAVPDNVIAQRIESAGESLAEVHESDAIAALKKEGTTSADTTAITKANVFEKIVHEVKNMKARGMKVDKMRIAVSADVEACLLLDDKFANTSSTIGAELVREGVIGKIAGVTVKPNYLMGEEVDFIIYDRRFTQKHEAWEIQPTVQDIKDGKHIGCSALQGRSIGGLKVVNPLGVQVKLNKTVAAEDSEKDSESDGDGE